MPHTCLNCGAELGGEFCARCGQRALEPRVTVRDFVHEFATEHFGLDTKVAHTLFTLVRWPGRLTADFLAGRRIRYVPPLRLYLSLSVLFFLFSAVARHVEPSSKGGFRIKENGVDVTDSAARRDSAAVTRAPVNRKTSFGAVAAMTDDTLHDNAVTKFVKRRASERLAVLEAGNQNVSTRLTESFMHDLPDALFLLVPALAGLLALLYLGQKRSYAEHFVFALHVQAFVFLAVFLTLIPSDAMSTVVVIALPVYMFVALRTVYAESRLRTAGKLAALGVGYIATVSAIMAALGLAVFLFG